MWTPITETELYDKIFKAEILLNGDLWNFWQLIKVVPEKWREDSYGQQGNGFWVVAICGRRVIWYNDIEEGFNISQYHEYGHIDEYFCNQDEINEAVVQLYDLIRFGGNLLGQASAPYNML